MKRRLAHHLALCALALLAIGWLVVLRPASLGGPATYVVIRGDSMEPTYATGDLVIVQAAATYAVGDVVAYRVPDGDIGEGLVVVHRIAGGSGADGYTLRGDNNPALDPWTPRDTDVAGRVWLHVPNLGRLIAFVHQPVIAGALGAAIMVAFIVLRAPRSAPLLGSRPAVTDRRDF
ncbi:MAG: signal peptidase I [Candidatus Limnocylindria bacterium]